MDGAVMGTCPNRIVVHLHKLKKVKDSRPVKMVPTAPSSPLHPNFAQHHPHQAHHEPPVLLLAKLQATDPPAQNLGEQTAQDDRVALGEPMNPQATTGAPVKESGLMVQTGGSLRRSSTLASPGSSVLGGGAGADGFGNGAAAGGWRRGVTGAAGQAPAARDLTASHLALVNSAATTASSGSAGEREPIPSSSTKAAMGSSTQADNVSGSPSRGGATTAAAAEITSLVELSTLPVEEIVAMMMVGEDERRRGWAGMMPAHTAE
ncbi:hypothetical protein PCASD_24135 [Puccinia coronata f. sp. avenae]|uniref:Uncharacterized protein n=1 Tax=Puccinia coronata f. sp. avenae TaxID=200324 RepID=A0A2N5TK48_9BASI|nr:hypothetical protein PCASD_24135 [Puccinia coronata f. sp. avenae]